MGVITAVFGGIIRDVLGGESPVILRREIYVIPALIGAIAFVTLRTVAGAPYPPAAAAGFALCFTVRALALYHGWSLPPYKSRPGRAHEIAAPEPVAHPPEEKAEPRA